MTSKDSHRECPSVGRSLKFTAHAAVQFQQRHNSRSDGAAAGQLLEELNARDSTELKRLVHNTFPMVNAKSVELEINTSCIAENVENNQNIHCNVDLIHVVNAPQMYGMYLLRKEEMWLTDIEYFDKEFILFHVTTKSRAVESLKSGLDWRLIQRSKFGRGVSFSDDANYYANSSSNEADADSQVIIVCAVLINKMYPVSGKRKKRNVIVPPDTADTTVSTNGRVYVKYNDFDFYPLYFMYYQRILKHLNESKYFNNNLNNKWQQTPVMQQARREQKQAQQQAKRKRKQARRILDQAPHMQEQALHMREQGQCMQKQGKHMREQAHHMRKQACHMREKARNMREQARHM